MTLDEAIELGRAWPSWEWARGQVYIPVVCGKVQPRHCICMSSEAPGHGEVEAFPDLRDPGTRGHALEQVREAWGAPRATTYPPRDEGGEWSVGGFVPGDDGACVFAYGATEAAALLAARRAAPPRCAPAPSAVA